MSKSKIFDGDSDSDIELKTNNEYAKKYDEWRKKEELHKFKARYGEDALDNLTENSSSSSEDDEDAIELNEEVEKEFFKTLSYLKNKDPRIYDEKTKFFENTQGASQKSIKKKKDKPMTIKDYERQLILEKNGKLSDSEDDPVENEQSHSPTYVEEQQRLKESLKNALNSDDEGEDNNDNWGGLFKARQKNAEEKAKEEDEYKEWLKGQKEEIKDKHAESELKPLKDYWNNPNLDDDERFLRDYILNKKFLNKEDDNYIPTYEEVVHDSDKDLSNDEETIEKQEEFEHKYNFRFEEPDPEFIKRYPRTMETSVRKTDDRRKLKRAEVKERKIKEKEEKKAELRKLQELKRKEIEEKIEKLKEITGNTDVAFKDEDLEEDFDPEAHDRRMQTLFNDDFYQGAEEDQKPEFPELDEYLEVENWDRWQGEEVQDSVEGMDEENAPHCEDEDFNMDADYNPSSSTKNELIENSKTKKKRRRKSQFAKVVSQPKPVFDPNDKTFEEYLDEYYKLDCEDFIGDLPCRFKYRKVIPNSFGLTLDEILRANDRELNKWCSLKKAVQYRPEHVEKYDQIAFEKKAQNLALKKKILPSLFKDEAPKEENCRETTKNKKLKVETVVQDSSNNDESIKSKEIADEASQNSEQANSVPKKKKKKKGKKGQKNVDKNSNNQNQDQVVKNKARKRLNSGGDNIVNSQNNKKKAKFNKNKEENVISDARLTAYGINPKKFKNKLKYSNK